MVQFAGGALRLARMAANGVQLGSPSAAVDYTIADNVAVPRWAINHPGATSQDQGESWDELIEGKSDEYLAVQFYHTAAVTLATASCKFNIPVKRISLRAGKKFVENYTLRLGDRMTKSTASTINDPRGLNDNPVTRANEWSDVERVGFRSAENIRVSGFLEVYIDGA